MPMLSNFEDLKKGDMLINGVQKHRIPLPEIHENIVSLPGESVAVQTSQTVLGGL
jgi:hypothetical protein